MDTPWPTVMPFNSVTEKGLICRICAAAWDTTKWAKGTAAPSRKRGQAEQHCVHDKHIDASEKAKTNPTVHHYNPLETLYPWLKVTLQGAQCTLCASKVEYGPWLPNEESPPWVLGTASKEHIALAAHERGRGHAHVVEKPPSVYQPKNTEKP